MSSLESLIIETGPSPEIAVIWLHGLGASGHDFEPVVPELAFAQERAVRFIFPHAPELPVTINGGMRMPAWYDILAMDIDRKVDELQLRASSDAVAQLIEQQREQGLRPENIIIGGFSQGGAVAYELALSYPERLGGLFALSTYYATAGSIQRSTANETLPVFVAHGSYDPIVPEALGQQAVETLKAQGYQPEYQSYGMEHSLCLEEVHHLNDFLTRCLN
ncbi:alpha/beta fold hydrolase [Marinobacter sp.]|uniref:alpha/beta hydrolase n=1 Tax=Marinobacter sp. TaxID=50741 RepID=UPI0019FCC96B|nr:alpha/beta fold hydrolase [Marinobacter sp.]MBE0486244.1 alpha/beta fold hydrolase [Marinobacter sp.]